MFPSKGCYKRIIKIRGFPLGEMNGDFVAKFIWACTSSFACRLAGEILLFKVVKNKLN